MQGFKERLAAMVGHLGEHVALFAREEFARAVTAAIVGDRAGSPATAILMVVHDGIKRSNETPLHTALREFMADEASGAIVGAIEAGMSGDECDLYNAIDGLVQMKADQHFDDARVRQLIREEMAKAAKEGDELT